MTVVDQIIKQTLTLVAGCEAQASTCTESQARAQRLIATRLWFGQAMKQELTLHSATRRKVDQSHQPVPRLLEKARIGMDSSKCKL